MNVSVLMCGDALVPHTKSNVLFCCRLCIPIDISSSSYVDEHTSRISGIPLMIGIGPPQYRHRYRHVGMGQL